MYHSGADPIPAATTSRVIPAGVLEPGRDHTITVGFARLSDATPPGAAFSFTVTTARIIAAGAPEPYIEYEFNFTHAEGELVGEPPDPILGVLAFRPETAYCLRAFLSDDDYPATVTFSGPIGSDLDAAASTHRWSWDHGWCYRSPEITTAAGDYPPDGLYTVRSNASDFQLDIDPDGEARQVIPVPTVTMAANNDLARIDWQYTDPDSGLPAPYPFHIEGLHLQLERHGHRPPLYERNLSGDTTGHILETPVAWEDLRRISISFDDEHDTRFRSGFRRLGVFHHQYVFEHDAGGFAAVEEGMARGRLNFPPQISHKVRFTAWDEEVPPSVGFTSPVRDHFNLDTPLEIAILDDEGIYTSFNTPYVCPPRPPKGGEYTVDYKGADKVFDRENPLAEVRQIFPLPTVFIDADGWVDAVEWSWRDMMGQRAPAPDFIDEIRVLLQYKDMSIRGGSWGRP